MQVPPATLDVVKILTLYMHMKKQTPILIDGLESNMTHRGCNYTHEFYVSPPFYLDFCIGWSLFLCPNCKTGHVVVFNNDKCVFCVPDFRSK